MDELAENHAVDDGEFLVNDTAWQQVARYKHGMKVRHKTFGDRNPLEQEFQEIKGRAEQFSKRLATLIPKLLINGWKQLHRNETRDY